MSAQAQSPTIRVQETQSDGTPHERIITLSQRPMTIGRSKNNDIQLSTNLISSNHARIEPYNNGYCIIDVGSTNGTFSGQQQLAKNQPHPLRHNDTVCLGAPCGGSNVVVITYLEAQAAAQQQTPSPTPIRTPQQPSPPGPTATPTPGAASPMTQMLNLSFNPQAAKTTIGREGCDINLNHPMVSRFHAQIDRMADGSHVLRDAGSTNGTFVNGNRINHLILSNGDIIKIGPFKHIYQTSGIVQFDQRGGLRVDARELHLEVMVKGEKRTILNKVSFSIAPKEFVALVGGSGAGKSTLMKAIGGFNPVKEGKVFVNGDDYYSNFDSYRTMLGYVPQDDILHRTLPVSNTLGYIANLRLPPDTSNAETKQLIDQVLDTVDMTEHRDKDVQDLSGGQRKRVSIAAELLADPNLFFLDEPTSGLDPGMEKKMMQTLRKLADGGKTVVLVTHATENIDQCHQVVFMAKGRLIYYGPPTQALGFFGVQTFSEIYTRLDGSINEPDNQSAVQSVLQSELTAWRQRNPQDRDIRIEVLWEMKYKNSQQYRTYVYDRLQQPPPEPAVGASKDKSGNSPRLSPIRQYIVQTRRYFELVFRDKINLLILLAQAPIIAILLWLLAHSEALVGVVGKDLIPRVQAQSLLFVIAIVSVWFGINNAAREITKEFPIFDRERISKLNIFSYLFSKITVLGLLIFIQNILLLGIISIPIAEQGIEFPSTRMLDPLLLPVWLEMFVTMLLTSLAGTALGLLISSLSKTPDWATSFVPLLLIPQVLFAGLIFKIEEVSKNIDTIGEVINVIVFGLSLLMISHWSFDALGTTFNLESMCQLPNIETKDEDGKKEIVSQCDKSKELKEDTDGLKCDQYPEGCDPPPEGCPPTMPNENCLITSPDCVTKMCLDDMPFLKNGIEEPDAFPDAFIFKKDHLLQSWGALGAFVVICLGATVFLLRKRS